ncbi:MAG: methyltransferase domain-containing protein [Desulfobacterales bacterium]
MSKSVMKHSQIRCPICDSTATTEFFTIGEIPVFCNVLWERREEALNAATGDINLRFCHTCTHVYNSTFDPKRLQYSPKYETSLHYSPTFQNYTVALAEKLVRTYGLYDKDIIEIGCGKGDFLHLLAEMGNNRCLGFDPSYDPLRIDQDHRSQRIAVIQDVYSERYSRYHADFIACRQVLEHVMEPRNFIKMIRRTVEDQDQTVVFVEVPNVMFTLMEFGIWDLIYEHCSYFTSLSLVRLFLEAGFIPLNVNESFGRQYLCIEARPGINESKNNVNPQHLSVTEIEKYIFGFANNYRKKITEWESELQAMLQSDIKAVVWGAGSKGITFLNVLKSENVIEFVIDVNPHKHGLYVPGTGQQVVAPDMLTDIQPDVVIVMNPIYLDEINKMIAERQIGANRKMRLIDAGH